MTEMTFQNPLRDYVPEYSRVGGKMCLHVCIMPSCSLTWKTPHCVVLADKKVVPEWAQETTGEHISRAAEGTTHCETHTLTQIPETLNISVK